MATSHSARPHVGPPLCGHDCTSPISAAPSGSDGTAPAVLGRVRYLHCDQPDNSRRPRRRVRRGRGTGQRARHRGGDGAVLRAQPALGLVRSVAALGPPPGHAVLHTVLRRPGALDADGALRLGPHGRSQSRLAHAGGGGGQRLRLRRVVGGAVRAARPGAVSPASCTERAGGGSGPIRNGRRGRCPVRR
jgi:hypothetical protein